MNFMGLSNVIMEAVLRKCTLKNELNEEVNHLCSSSSKIVYI
jgi:hypothetical protein